MTPGAVRCSAWLGDVRVVNAGISGYAVANMKDDPISFWLSDGLAWIKPTGDGCHLNASKVKAFVKRTVQRGCHNFMVDLSECTGMDEDFMGTLAGTALRVRELGRGKVQIVGCPPALDAQLRNLGLERLFDM